MFQAALARPPAERAAFLSDVCGHDRELRSEVESLLVAHAEARSFAERPVIDALGESAAVETIDRLYAVLE